MTEEELMRAYGLSAHPGASVGRHEAEPADRRFEALDARERPIDPSLLGRREPHDPIGLGLVRDVVHRPGDPAVGALDADEARLGAVAESGGAIDHPAIGSGEGQAQRPRRPMAELAASLGPSRLAPRRTCPCHGHALGPGEAKDRVNERRLPQDEIRLAAVAVRAGRDEIRADIEPARSARRDVVHDQDHMGRFPAAVAAREPVAREDPEPLVRRHAAEFTIARVG